MSNYRPANYWIWADRIKAGVLQLMERRIYEVNNKFPLTIHALQQALIPPATLSLINTLEAEYGVKNIPTYNDVWFTLPENPTLMPRPAVIECEARQGELGWYLLEDPFNGRNRPTFNLYCPLEEKEERMKRTL